MIHSCHIYVPGLPSSGSGLEFQAGLASRIRQSLYTAVVAEASAIECDCIDARCLCLFGDTRADDCSGLDVAGAFRALAHLRLYGRGRSHPYGSERYGELRPRFAAITAPCRGVVELAIRRVQESCGWGVPLFSFQGHRQRLLEHNESRSQEEYIERRYRKNRMSIDGLPGLERP